MCAPTSASRAISAVAQLLVLLFSDIPNRAGSGTIGTPLLITVVGQLVYSVGGTCAVNGRIEGIFGTAAEGI